MARPNVSLEHIALALTALGTSAVLAACSRSAEPASNVHADQTQASGTAAAPPPPPPVTTPAEDAPKQKLSAMPDTQPTATASASASSPMRRSPGGGSGGGDKGTTGQASCGAGNCTAVPKKK